MKNSTASIDLNLLVGVLVAIAVAVAIVVVVRLDVTGSGGSRLGDEFTYDIGDLAKVEPALILYEESAPPLATGLQHSRAIAVGPAGNIYVAGDKVVNIYDQSRTLTSRLELSEPPQCITLAPDGRIFVGLKDRLGVYNSRGELLQSWDSLGPRAVLTSIAVYRDNVFLAEAGYAASTMTTDGQRVYAIFATGDIACFDFYGRRLWAKNLGTPDSSYGYASSLEMFRDRVIIQYDHGTAEDGKSRLIALDGKTGEVVWQTKRPVPNSWTSPILAQTADGYRIITAADRLVRQMA